MGKEKNNCEIVRMKISKKFKIHQKKAAAHFKPYFKREA